MHLYNIAKDVEGGGGDRILYIVDSIRVKIPYPLLFFSSDLCGVLCRDINCLVVWLLYFLVDLVALV